MFINIDQIHTGLLYCAATPNKQPATIYSYWLFTEGSLYQAACTSLHTIVYVLNARFCH